ncbi:TolC family protein [Larsenimonas salina]|uniref:TolC family protein n=1 Tax=Larsenimonas salina TaxID=1295565 RepID=UPI0020746681|nr:TolC family protein [Larsenimonas salina]MCM5704935.1 TolC family protein [Larsenimonas salina]
MTHFRRTLWSIGTLLFSGVALTSVPASGNDFMMQIDTGEANGAVQLNLTKRDESNGAALPSLSSSEQMPLSARNGGSSRQTISASKSQVSYANTVPSLPVLFARALENDASLTSQRLQAEATGLEVPMAWARLKPQIDVTVLRSYTESDNIYTDGNLNSCVQNPETGEPAAGSEFERRCEGRSTDTTRQIRLSQPLFSMERIRQVQKANRQRDAAEQQIVVNERDLALETAEAYLNAFYLSRRVELLASKRESLELQVTQAQRAYDLGIGDRIDLLAARSEHDRTLADIAAARNDYDNARSTLERLTGVSPDFDHFALSTFPDEGFKTPPPLDQMEPLISNNAEVVLAQSQLKVARADTSTRQAGYYPEVNLNLTWQDRNSDDPYRESEDKTATIQARMNLYRGGYTSTSIRQGELRQQAAMADVSDARRQSLEKMRQYHRNIGGDITRLEALAQSIRSGELYLEAADKGAALGLRDLVDVLGARADLYSQRIQYVETFRQLLLDRLNLKAASGKLATEDLIEVMHQISTIIEAGEAD